MRTVTGRDPFTGQCLELDLHEGRIVGLRPAVCETDLWIAPGFVDLQVNGFAGIDFNGEPLSPEDILRLVSTLAAEGTTTFLPTVITASEPMMARRLASIAAARAAYAEVFHTIPAVHLEGPHISSLDGYRGAHPLAEVRPPSLEEFNRLQDASGGLVRLVTLSPHWPNSAEFIHALVRRGVVVSLGHTHASPEQLRAAVEAGASLSTHLGNGIAAMLPRHPNPIWTQLADDRLDASFIADGVHLDAETLCAMLRCKGYSRSILVSDSVALAGCVPGSYETHIGGTVTVQEDGSIRMRDSGLLAGSGISLWQAVGRATELAGCSLAEAVQMATQNPANLLHLNRGRMDVGSAADLILFQWELHSSVLRIAEVIVRGESVFDQTYQEGRQA